jgi:hypothetical protein
MNTAMPSMDLRPAVVHDPLQSRVRAEFLEMPGLVLSAVQATRLFGADGAVCTTALAELVESGFLTVEGCQFRRV